MAGHEKDRVLSEAIANENIIDFDVA